MTLFQTLCRESGSILHLLLKPVNAPVETRQTLHQASTTTTQQVSETTILRRTVIEEVEVKKVSVAETKE